MTSSSSDDIDSRHWAPSFFGALVVAAAPFAGYPLGLYDSVVAHLIAFAICGLAAGWVFGFIAIAAGVVTYPGAIGVFYYTGVMEGDGVFVAIVGFWGSALFCVTALAGASVRLLVLRRGSVSGFTEE